MRLFPRLLSFLSFLAPFMNQVPASVGSPRYLWNFTSCRSVVGVCILPSSPRLMNPPRPHPLPHLRLRCGPPCRLCVGLFPRAREFGENVRQFIPRLRFFSLFVWLVKLRLGRAHCFHSLGRDQSTVAQRAETTVAERS